MTTKMKYSRLFTGVVMAMLLLVPASASAVAVCSLCIVEVQSQGINSAAEDYIVVANNTSVPYDTTGVALKYYTAAGNNTTSRNIALSGSLPARSSMVFVSAGLATANPTARQFPSGLALYDAGGSLELVTGSTLIDRVSWGVVTDPLRSATPGPVHSKGASLTRKHSALGFLDTDNISADFEAVWHACSGLSINEIQPFAVGLEGEDILPGLELVKYSNAVLDIDCPILINGVKFFMAAGDLQATPSIIIINNVLDNLGDVLDLPLLVDAPNTVQLITGSFYGDLALPITSTLTLQPVLSDGQTYAFFVSIWKPTYSPTLGSSNKLSTVLVLPTDPPPTVPPDACTDVKLNEMLPNPTGDDTGNEWIELIGLTDKPSFLGDCGVQVITPTTTTTYAFGPDQFIDANGLDSFTEFSDGVSMRTLTLRNSDTNTISFGRIENDQFVPIQTVQYKDAPEGQSWARFSDGWKWVANPTKNLSNTTQTTEDEDPSPTEFPAPPPPVSPPPTVQPAAPISIVELLPNPASPQTDEADEYLELFNPTNVDVDLSGYKVQTGYTYSYSVTLQNQTIPANGYLVIKSGNTSLSLANAGGQAHLLDPTGNIISTTDVYTDAPEGQAWALVDDVWKWTGSPTVGATNIYSDPVLTAVTTKASKATKATKAVKAVSTKKPATAGNVSEQNGRELPNEPAPLHFGVLAGVGALAVGYAVYEYRKDLANRIYQFRRYRKARRATRSQSTGR